MTILVTGASGQIGGLTAAAIAAAGHAGELRLLTSRAEGIAALEQAYPGAEVVVGDLLQTQTLTKAVAGVDKIFMNIPDFMPEPEAMRSVVAAAGASGRNPFILRFVAYPPGGGLEDLHPVSRDSGIGAAKHLKAKPVLADSGLPHAFLNAPCWFMSNLSWMSARAVQERNELVIPAPIETPFIAPADIGAAAARILLDESLPMTGTEYTILGPETLSFTDVAATMSDVFGREIRYNSDVEVFREYFGDLTDPMVEYFVNTVDEYEQLPSANDLNDLLARPATTLRDWLGQQREVFTKK